jgi:diguanylate cyclase (GGDEF)-like protein/PAS domain S-box-containing protein
LSTGPSRTAGDEQLAGLMAELAGNIAVPLLGTRSHPPIEVIARAAQYTLIGLAAIRQHKVSVCAATGVESDMVGRRPFSVLPYVAVAVAAVDVLLLLTLWGTDPARPVVGLVAVALTGLVIARQLGAFQDNARLLAELGRQERRFRALVQHAADVIAIYDRNGVISYISPGVRALTGHTPEELISTTGPAVHPDDQVTAQLGFAKVIREPQTTHAYEIRVSHTNGTWRRVRITLTNLLDDPAVGGIVTNSSDITEAHAYHAQLSHQASHDSLTNLANRSLFDERLRRILSAADNSHVSLLLIDLDDFKPVNDTLGHQAGDALLITVAERLRRGVRPQDLVARLGGDEFAVILEDATDTQVDDIVCRLLNTLTEPVTIDGHHVCVNASVGLASTRPQDDNTRLINRADQALYLAKGTGKGRYVRYSRTA